MKILIRLNLVMAMMVCFYKVQTKLPAKSKTITESRRFTIIRLSSDTIWPSTADKEMASIKTQLKV